MVERLNATAETLLSLLVDENQRDWDLYIPLLMMAYRSSEHASTKVSACKMMLRRDITLPVDLLFGNPQVVDNEMKTDYRYFLTEKLEVIYNFARRHLQYSFDAMKRNYDCRKHFQKYNEGDHVWFHNLVKKNVLNYNVHGKVH